VSLLPAARASLMAINGVAMQSSAAFLQMY